MLCSPSPKGKWKMLKCGNRSTEMEVRKRKYGSEKKSCLSVFSVLLTHNWQTCILLLATIKGCILDQLVNFVDNLYIKNISAVFWVCRYLCHAFSTKWTTVVVWTPLDYCCQARIQSKLGPEGIHTSHLAVYITINNTHIIKWHNLLLPPFPMLTHTWTDLTYNSK